MLHLELQLELEVRLQEEARRVGLAVERYVEEIVAKQYALKGYREGRLTETEVQRLLGLGTRMQVHAFLAENDVDIRYTEEHLLQDIAASAKLHLRRTEQVVSAA